jgi:lysophospholipase L1-like esterase
MRRSAAWGILIFAGVVAAFVVLETVLRLTGSVYYNRRQAAEQAVIRADNASTRMTVMPVNGDGTGAGIRILCVGDSHTFGVGAEPGYSYPAQLQRLLDRESLYRCTVYNGGVPGLTAIRLRYHLPDLLDRYKPQIVVLLIGMNDTNNPFVSDLYEIFDNGGDNATLAHKVKHGITRLRSYRLIEYVAAGIRHGIAARRVRVVDPSLRRTSDDYVDKAKVSFRRGEMSSAEKYFELAQSADPGNERVYLEQGYYYQSVGKYDLSIRNCARVLEINPLTPHRKDLYRFLFLLYQLCGQSADDRKRIRALIHRIPSDEMFQVPGNPLEISQARQEQVFRSNLDSLVTIIEKHGAVVVIQTYAQGIPSLMNALRAVAARRGVRLVDNDMAFRKYKDPKSYFAPDGHPNKAGYRVMAAGVMKHIAEVIRLREWQANGLRQTVN